MISETIFFFTAKISNALCWSISWDTKSFLTSVIRGVKPCIIRKYFPARIFPQPQEWRARLVTLTNKAVPRPSVNSFAFSQAKHFFFSFLKNAGGYRSGWKTLSVLLLKRLGRDTHLQNGNEPNARNKNFFCIKWMQQC